MSGCYCTGACRQLGFCPNQQHGATPLPMRYWFTPDDGAARIKKLEEQVAALQKSLARKKKR